MPAKLTHTQEASFLLDIIKHSDLKSINWQAIADKKQIKKGAAQMRYARLKQAIEKAEAAESGIALPPSPSSADGQFIGSPVSQSSAAPVTPKKPRANKVEKTKTPGSATPRKKKININTSMISPLPSPNASMMSTSSMNSSMHQNQHQQPSMQSSMHSPMTHSMTPMSSSMSPSMHVISPSPAPPPSIIKMEAQEEYQQMRMMPAAPQSRMSMGISHMPGMPY